jgi:transcriptional regulator with XRE-family HTH domain
LNISQKELSEQTGLTLRTIQGIENNEVKPSLYSLKDIGEVLKCDLSEL